MQKTPVSDRPLPFFEHPTLQAACTPSAPFRLSTHLAHVPLLEIPVFRGPLLEQVVAPDLTQLHLEDPRAAFWYQHGNTTAEPVQAAIRALRQQPLRRGDVLPDGLVVIAWDACWRSGGIRRSSLASAIKQQRGSLEPSAPVLSFAAAYAHWYCSHLLTSPLPHAKGLASKFLYGRQSAVWRKRADQSGRPRLLAGAAWDLALLSACGDLLLPFFDLSARGAYECFVEAGTVDALQGSVDVAARSLTGSAGSRWGTLPPAIISGS